MTTTSSREDVTSASAPPRRGRPRNEGIDERILTAAQAVYAERGWAGFNFDVVARQASVSKDAIYRRYASRIQLLQATMIHNRWLAPAAPQDDELRGYLIERAREYFDSHTGESGVGSLRIFIEAVGNPELLAAYHERAVPGVLAVRARVRAAIEAGELPLVSTPTALLDAILGGVIMHVLATPPDLRDIMIAEAGAFIEELVDLTLRGAGYRFPAQSGD